MSGLKKNYARLPETLFVTEPSGITGLSKETCISTGKQQWGWATRKTVVPN
jgi:hypothetical protein